MKKSLIFALLLGVNLFGASEVCKEYVKQSRLYLDELYAKESKFDEFKQRQSGQEAMIMQNNDEKFCKSELEKVNKLLSELKK